MAKNAQSETVVNDRIEEAVANDRVEEVTIPLQERDEFADPQYLDPDAKLPRIQAVRGSTPKMCGYFVAINQMAAAGWKDFDEKQLITYTFESTGAEEQGILVQNPRMLVCPKTPVLAYDRKLSQDTKSTVILGRYTQEMKEIENVSNLQFFQVFLLDANNQALHQIPLSYKAAGANQASFSVHWQEFCRELNICHSITNGIPAKQKDTRFNSLGVFCFKTARELVGDKQKGFACRVVDHERPTLENWRDKYFIGFNQSIRQYVWESLEPTKPLMVPGNPEALALPAGTETGEIAATNE